VLPEAEEGEQGMISTSSMKAVVERVGFKMKY
jgi:hypothetical protein